MKKPKTPAPEDIKLEAMHTDLQAKGFKHTHFEVSYQSMGPLGNFVVIFKPKAHNKVTDDLRAFLARRGFACTLAAI